MSDAEPDESARLHAEVEVDQTIVDKMLAWHGIGPAQSFAVLRGGLINTNVLVSANNTKYVARMYVEHRSKSDVEFEVSVLEHLATQGYPAQRVVPSASGEIGDAAGRNFVVLEYIEGQTLTAPVRNIAVLEQAGRMAGRFRRAVRGFVPRGARERADTAFLRELVPPVIERIASSNAADAAVLRRSWEEVAGRVGEDPEPSTVVHADIAPENMVFCDGVAVALIDFDDAYFGSGLVDVATPAMDFAAAEGELLDPAMVARFLTAYAEEDAPIALDEVIDHMWLNCFRYLSYTAELTMGAGRRIHENTYAKRLLANFLTAVQRAELRSNIARELSVASNPAT